MKVPPGPRGSDILGFLKQPLAFLDKTARQYGPISYFRVLNQRIYLIDEPDLIQDILVHRQHEFVRDTGATLLRELVGDGLLTRDEPAHKERRRALQPAFHRAQVAAYARVMVAECERAMDSWRDDVPLDIASEMKRLTLAIVGAALFGADFRNEADRIAAVLERVLNRSRWIAPGLALVEPVARLYRQVWPTGPSLFFGNERAELEAILEPIMTRRRQSGGEDILSLLLADFDDNDAINEIVTMVLAGHETTATALAWAWELIARHPDVAAKLAEEIDGALGDRSPDAQDIPSLRYTTAVFNEALRLYPSAPVFGRRPKTAIELGGYQIPAGASILVSPYITQRNPRWFPDPESFQPERWENMTFPKFAFFPFGGGAKMCIGEPFARMEAILLIAAITQRWKLSSTTPNKVAVRAAVTLRPDGPLWMRPQVRTSISMEPSSRRA